MTAAGRLADWDGLDIAALVGLERRPDGVLRNRHGDANPNGRSFGGQLLGQAMMAAHDGLAAGRRVSAMQFQFLQGAVPHAPMDIAVETLQHGKRFTSRAARGSQDGRLNFSAHVTFNVPMDGPEHQSVNAFPDDPEALPSIDRVSASAPERLAALGSYPFVAKPCMDIRIADLPGQTAPDNREARLRFWIRARHPLPDVASVTSSVFAYLSDWCVNFSSFAPHVLDSTASRPLYLASLNHSIWLHRPFTPSDWMHVDTWSPAAADGLGLAVVQVHDRHGIHLATTAQQSLIAFA